MVDCLLGKFVLDSLIVRRFDGPLSSRLYPVRKQLHWYLTISGMYFIC